ncbi:hypothetical protein RB195_006163 [Necator americanus]|uniref:Endonuclease/exonuclease/phosphatase domain-containing protein n=1 Tax=Necator americanus TaxID=51031 RepID=A0ABR1BU53_NECAM
MRTYVSVALEHGLDESKAVERFLREPELEPDQKPSRKVKSDTCKLIYHGTSNRNGVSVILNETFRNSVAAVGGLSTIGSPNGCKSRHRNVGLKVVSAYAPQVGCSKEEKACFWEDSKQYVQSLEGKEALLIGGDFNGHVVPRKDGFESCHGGYGYGVRNDVELRNLDSKVIPRDHVAAQHNLLVIDLKIFRPRKRHPRNETLRIRWWNLKDRKKDGFASCCLYGCESWPTKKALEKVLHAIEMRMLRWTLGVTLKDHLVYNDTVRSIFSVATETEKMKEA